MDIKFASGVVPTPHGDITLHWQQKDKPASFTQEVTIPEGVTAEVWLPVGNIMAPELSVNGSKKLPGGVKTLSGRNCCMGAEISKPGNYELMLSGGKTK